MIQDMTHEECLGVLGANFIGRLAYIAASSPFVIPITYYYHQEPNNNSIISYSLEGHKIDSMRINGLVALQVDEIESVNQWRSVLVHGEFEELERIDAKKELREFSQGVKALINRDDDKDVQFIHEFSSKLEAGNGSPIVFRINIQEITGKKRVD